MEVKVDGVLNFNNSTRNELLKKNLGKYSQWLGKLIPAIGEAYEIPDYSPLSSSTDGKGLYAFTHDNQSDFSKFINSRYFVKGREKEYYEDKYEENVLLPEQIQPWTEDRQDYLQYIDEVLGTDIVIRNAEYINNLLAGTHIENALRQTEVGVIKNIDVSASLQGAMVTNPNNMSGKNTKIGTIANYLYAATLYNGAIFNSDRENAKIHQGENYVKKQYITPYLVTQYGNNLDNVMRLGDMLRIGTNETHIREDLSEGITFIDSREDYNNLDSLKETNSQIQILEDQINEAEKYIRERKYTNVIYTLYDGEGYVNYIEGKESVLDLTDFTSQSNFTSVYKSNTDKTYDIYNENDNATYTYENAPSNEDDVSWEHYEAIDFNKNEKSILSKTAQLFNYHKLNTLVGRFHTSVDGGIPTEQEFIDTAKSKYGNSHGRNLLVRNSKGKITNDYSNPYCRTWTYHHQYNQIKKLIRPFIREDGDEMVRPLKMKEIQSLNQRYRAYQTTDNNEVLDGGLSLAQHTVLQDNGFVRITPHKSSDKQNPIDSIKDCMFSIENLAWKDVLDHNSNLSKEQRGPNGGRIMWFPPYDLDFQENVNVNWNENSFIGRGEKVYTYTDTTRTGTLSFTLLIDHPAIMNSAAYSSGMENTDGPDPNADILRFFAGCEMLGIAEEEKEKPQEPPVEEPKPKPEPKQKQIHFKVYFPNNFSGVYGSKDEVKQYDNLNAYVEGGKESLLNLGLQETDFWWWYLLCGNDTVIPSGVTNFRGYEMSKTQSRGITSGDYASSAITACAAIGGKSGNVIGTPGCKTYDTTKKYSYQIDEDLHEILHLDDSYIDSQSFALNSNLENRGENDYTFTEVIVALLRSNVQYKNFIENSTISDYLENYYQEDKVKELVDIFTGDDVTFNECQYIGSADDNNPSTTKILGNRRAHAVSNMVKWLLGKDMETKLIDAANASDNKKKEITSSSDKSNKEKRCCDFTIFCTIGGSEDLSKAGSAEEKQEEPSGTLTPEIYYQTLREESEYINAYNENNEISEGIKNYIENVLWFCNAQGEKVDKSTLDLEDITVLCEEIDLVTTKIGDDFLKMGYFIKGEGVGEIESFGHKYDNRYISASGLSSDFSYSSNAIDKSVIETYFRTNNIKVTDMRPVGGESPILYDFPLFKYPDSVEGQETEQITVGLTSPSIQFLMILFMLNKTHVDAKYHEIMWKILREVKYSGVSLYEQVLSKMGYIIYEINDGSITQEQIDSLFADAEDLIYNKTNFNVKLNEAIQQIQEDERQKEIEAEKQRIEEERKAKAEAEAERKRRFNADYRYALDTLSEGNIPDNRYETEADYFKSLEVTDPVLFKKLTDKFKYFNPAFHSMSPEGFNARLTFLQQCTRQGMTLETRGGNSGNNENGGIPTRTAANLAFGRMPVCVLRIGDFIHTRIIIQSMSINYENNGGMQWDLNPEGAGVQPMYAKVSLTIVLLGGQSLGAPISRLQNAISFNYYANAEVYDNRSDVAVYRENVGGSDKRIDNVDYKRVWVPLQGTNNLVEYNGKQVDSAIAEYETAHANDAHWNTWSDEKGDEVYSNQQEITPSQEDKTAGEYVHNNNLTHVVTSDITVRRLSDLYYEPHTVDIDILTNDTLNSVFISLNGIFKPTEEKIQSLQDKMMQAIRGSILSVNNNYLFVN